MYRNEIDALTPLSDMKMENIFNMSQTEDNGYYFYNITRTIRFDSSTIDRGYYFKYIVDRNMPWTTLSYQIYNTIDLWWLICVVNNIDNPVEFATPGASLKIIKPVHVSSVIAVIKQQLQ